MKNFILAVGLATIIFVNPVLSASFQQISGLSFQPSYMSDDASVLVGTYDNHAYRWKAGVETQISNVSWANGVSGDGRVMIGSAYFGDEASYAFHYTNGILTNLGLLPGQGGSDRSYAEDATYDGSVIVGSSGNQAVRWDHGVIEGLGFLLGETTSWASVVSDNGSVVAGRSGGKGFIWKNNMMTPIDILTNYDRISITGISDSGERVIGYCSPNSMTRHEAFYWENGKTIGLGDLPGGDLNSAASDISADGSIIIGRGKTGAGYRAFIWDDVHGIRDLKGVLETNYGLNLSDWILETAGSISPDGKTIMGTGVGPNGSASWMVVIPEPTTLCLLATGCILLLKRNKK
jgi:probable HAF family extracellular repeat protein